MRLALISDLHLEFHPYDLPLPEADVLVVAGDLATGLHGIDWLLKKCIRQPVIYVFGNHEFYGQVVERLIEKAGTQCRGSNIHFLEKDSITIDGVQFAGTTFWTDFDLYGDRLTSASAVQSGMNDYRKIRTLPKYAKLKAKDTRSYHFESMKWLESVLSQSDASKTVVVSHHAPSSLSIPLEFKNDELSPGYASNLEGFIMKWQPKLWVHGHIHRCARYMIGSTQVVNNARGYPGEQSGFNSAFVLDI